MKLFHWGMILRYLVYGVVPLVVSLMLLQRFAGADVATGMLILAFLLPFVALGWLAFQHFRHRDKP